MDSRTPFEVSETDIREADLLPSDLGMWCLIVDGCYHLFATEEQAQKARAKLLEGGTVR